MEHCTQAEAINKIEQRIKTQKQLGEETFAKVESVEKSLEEHRTAQQIHEEELASFMSRTNKVMKIVNEQLVPIYNKEQRNIIADEVIKERANNWKFWAKFITAIASVMVLVGWAIKQSLK